MTDTFYPNYREGRLDEQVSRFLTELSKTESKPLRLQTPEEVRRNSSVLAWVRERSRASRVENIAITGKDATVPIRIYTPAGAGPFPVLVYLHGGGWVFGSLDEADSICHSLSAETPAIVVSVDYRLSPEHKYPAALEDAYASVSWAAENIDRYNGDPARIGVAGESAGANMAAVVCQMARDLNGPPIRYQMLLCPCTDLLHLDTESYRLFGDGIWLCKANIEYYYDQYLKSREQAKEPYVSPLLAENLRNLPPAHIITAEFDILRDEGEAYARRLREESNRVTHKRYSGMIHSFFVLNGVFDQANEAIDECIALLRANLKV